MLKECITDFNERCQRSVVVNRVDMRARVLVRARFLDMPRDAKVAPVAKSLAGWSCRTSFSKVPPTLAL